MFYSSIFEIRSETLEQFPDTLLGNPSRRIEHYNPKFGDFYFDRNRLGFEGIFFFYLSGGKLRRPPDVPLEIFAEELKFFDLGREAMEQFRRDEGYIEEKKKSMPDGVRLRRLWLLFEYPESSTLARAIALCSITVILIR